MPSNRARRADCLNPGVTSDSRSHSRASSSTAKPALVVDASIFPSFPASRRKRERGNRSAAPRVQTRAPRLHRRLPALAKLPAHPFPSIPTRFRMLRQAEELKRPDRSTENVANKRNRSCNRF